MSSNLKPVKPREWPIFLLVMLFSGQLVFGETGDKTSDTINSKQRYLMQSGNWRIDYDLNKGLADIFFKEKKVFSNVYSQVRLPGLVTSKDYRFHRASSSIIDDRFGHGVKYVVESSNGGSDKMIQTFWLYENAEFFLADVEVFKKGGVASNFMSPLTTQAPSVFLPAGNDRALFVPFDNDMWVRYNAAPFGGVLTSYEVSALYDNDSRAGIVIGSIEHDVWKTGIRSTTSSNVITSLEVFGGITSTNITHDVLPHGIISGELIKSPRIFFGCFDDWRNGLESYATANATMTPPRTWTGGVPFGWNSWGKLKFDLTFDKAIQVSDFFAQKLPSFKNNGVTYIGLDSGWNSFTDDQLKEFVRHCESNHQEAGIYFTPFTGWTRDGNQPVTGTAYKFKDIFLYANGKIQLVDGGVALDPTHPGTQEMIEASIKRFKRCGFKYIKADFMTHGALEADHHYDPKITTGIEAYNAGMKFLTGAAGKDMYLNLSISPLFPAQYANSRRIACDTFGRIDEAEYMLNSLTYGWWLGKVYDFNDADHIVLEGHSRGENRARVTSSAIAGIFISGDDFSDSGKMTTKRRAEELLVNPGIMDIARIQKSFRPIEGNTGTNAARLFSYSNGTRFYLAAFNYSKTNEDFNVSFTRLGLKENVSFESTELWRGTTVVISNSLGFQLPPKDAAIFQLSRPADSFK